ncbi:flippase [Salinibacter ruber]|uniref:flippase n=1 Tax=Salinibacter ruber TaxID=146919 RepID=UPI0020733231|nr:flippase [Salinibacter ruber]
MSNKGSEDPQSFWVRWLPESVNQALVDRATLRALFENAGWLMGERVVKMAISFFVGVWVVRYLGPEQYGVYRYAISLVGLFTAVTTLGLDRIVIRNLSSSEWSGGEVMGTAFVLRIGGGIVTMLAVAAITFSSNDKWITQLAVLIVSGRLLFVSLDIYKLWFKSEIKSKYTVWVRSGVKFAYSGLQVLFILLGLSVISFVTLYLIQAGLKVFGAFIMYKYVSKNGTTGWEFDFELAQVMMEDAWPLIFSGISVAVYMKVDQVMLGRLVGEKSVGVYATAVKISEMWYFIPTAIAGTVFPKIISSKENVSEKLYYKRMQALYDLVSLLSYSIIVPVVLSAEPLIGFLFGVEYVGSAEILKVHMWAFLFVSLGATQGRWLVAENFTRFAMVAAILGASVNVGLNIILIPSYGGAGAAWATLISQAASTYVAYFFYKRLWQVLIQLSKALIVPLRLRAALDGIGDILRNTKK